MIDTNRSTEYCRIRPRELFRYFPSYLKDFLFLWTQEGKAEGEMAVKIHHKRLEIHPRFGIKCGEAKRLEIESITGSALCVFTPGCCLAKKRILVRYGNGKAQME
ncbi:hypothetical protein CEXT_279051 [Caerostris extrusa]|uniref:Uncharacterized protein n=1 Tax=Caerostris extrusa TaxID=172846 RepID=A0AAV4Y261_CAEEX|nr:hypothetical protein CEXT_279051 [Caerostris extrusa]